MMEKLRMFLIFTDFLATAINYSKNVYTFRSQDYISNRKVQKGYSEDAAQYKQARVKNT